MEKERQDKRQGNVEYERFSVQITAGKKTSGSIYWSIYH